MSLALAVALLGAEAAQAGSINAPAASAGAQATVPMTIAVTGSADPGSIQRVYVQAGGGTCTVTGGQPVPAPGSTAVIAEQPAPGPFSYSATYTPAVAGPHSLCAFLYGSSSGAGSAVSSGNFTVGPAPPPPPQPPAGTTTPPGATQATPVRTRCVVPTLKGRTYLGARLLIRRAGCSVGSVFRPDLRTSRRERARGRVLRVVTQYPRPRTARAKGARVTLRLAYVTPKAKRSTG
jgi:hypothetical protein